METIVFGKLTNYSVDNNKVNLYFENHDASIEFINKDIFRVYSRIKQKVKSFSIEELTITPVSVNVSKANDSIKISVDKIDIVVYDNFKLDIYYNNILICEDYKKERNPFVRHALELTESEEQKESSKKVSEGEGHKNNDNSYNHVIEVIKKHNTNNKYYGLGEKTGFLNKHGYEYEMWNTDEPAAHLEYFKSLYKSIPFYITLNDNIAYGIFFDNTYRTFFDMGKENDDYIYFGADNGNLDYYFIIGPCIKGVVRKYAYLTGRTPLPKKKMLGIHQSRWSYGRNKRVDQIIKGYEKNNLPLDVMHLDIDYMDNYKVFTYNNERFDLPKDTLRWKEKGIDIVTIIDPGVKAEDNYFIYEEGKENNYFTTQNGMLYHNRVWPGKSAYPDFTKEATRTWWAKNQSIMTSYGVSGIWNDMNEPASFDGPLPDDVEFANDGRPTNHLEIHNVYGHLMAKATYDGLKEATNERPFVITRACYAGSQKYTTFWTGDNQSLWIHLQMAVPMLCNMSLSGLSFIGTDIGGFGGDVTKELLIRWAEVGAFFPLCRNHASMLTRDQEPFTFDEETIRCYKKALDYRAELIPYYYDLFYNGELTGDPVLKPLIYNYQNDSNTHTLNDEFLIGDNILVSPVIEQGKTKKLVYLPMGNWYNKDENNIYKGENYYVIDAPLNICPTFIKCGSIIPTYPLSLHVENKDEIIFNICLDNDKEISYSHFYDDGKSFDYRNGIYTLYNITVSNNEINIDPVVNKYKLYNKITLRIYNKDNIQEIVTTGNKQNIKL